MCFELGKKQTLESFANQKSPVKIKNYNISNKYCREDVVITKKTNLIPTVVNYNCQNMDENMSVSTLSQVAGEQLVCVKGEVRQLFATKTVVFHETKSKNNNVSLLTLPDLYSWCFMENTPTLLKKAKFINSKKFE